MPEHRVVDTDAALAETIDRLAGEPRYALDTEFHRERTYYPRLALVQIAWPGDLVLVDPLAVDVGPLAAILRGDALAVLHAADQDLEVLEQACGVVPSRLLDTQVAAGFLGLSAPSLANLHDRFLGERLAKGDRLTDWLARPLRDSQLSYAASDVARLLEIHDRLTDELAELGRLDWVADECEELRTRDRGPREARDAWQRIKEVRQLRGRKLAVAQSVAAWREERAAERDLPPRFVLPDLGVVAVAQRVPRTQKDLRGLRGVDDRFLRGPASAEILAAVGAGLEQEPPERDGLRGPELDRALRPAVTLVSAWVSQLGRDLQLDTALLATRSDIEALLRGDDDARLAHGWRAELAGAAIHRLVGGEAALAFEGHGRLVLEERRGRGRPPE